MSHPFFERHRATLDRALQAIAERGYWSPYPESASPKVYGEGAAEAGKAAFDALKDKPFPLEQPGTVGTVGQREVAVRLRARHHVSEGRHRCAVRGGREGAGRVACRRARSLGRRLARDPAPDQSAELPLRQCRDAHDGAGVHDGLPGGRAARAGPRARGRRLRVGRAPPHSREGALGKAAGQERADPDGKALSRRAARHRPRHRLLHVSDVERLSRALRRPCHRQCRRREAASRGDPAAGAVREDRARGPRRGRASIPMSSRWSRMRRATTSRRSSRCVPTSRSSTSPAAPRTATGSRRTRGRRRCSPRSPASTRSSSTRPPTSRGSCATSHSRCRSTRARCARRRRTSTFRRAASTPPRAICRSTRWPARLPKACRSSLPIRRARSSFSARS